MEHTLSDHGWMAMDGLLPALFVLESEPQGGQLMRGAS